MTQKEKFEPQMGQKGTKKEDTKSALISKKVKITETMLHEQKEKKN